MITEDIDTARAALAAGERVVLVLGPDAPPVGAIDQRPGRMALIVGPPSDPAVRQAAEAMHAELFGV